MVTSLDIQSKMPSGILLSDDFIGAEELFSALIFVGSADRDTFSGLQYEFIVIQLCDLIDVDPVPLMASDKAALQVVRDKISRFTAVIVFTFHAFYHGFSADSGDVADGIQWNKNAGPLVSDDNTLLTVIIIVETFHRFGKGWFQILTDFVFRHIPDMVYLIGL